jgi:predicted Zn finger-like uncharacterized protein
MYLTCPNCETVYAVRAAMLRDGQGEVRCGTCRLIFNALDSLSDELPVARVPIESCAAPAAAAEMDGEEQQSATAASAAAEDPVAASADFPSLEHDGVPPALREDLDRLHAASAPVMRHTGLWLMAAFGLLALGFQYLWFAPEDLSRRFPQVRSQVESFCLRAGCMARAERAPQLMRVLSRDVRAHPRYEGALLVTATFSNGASWAQPFPQLRFSLYDVNGRTIAARTFTPVQYLAGVLPADARLPPGQAMQVALEMLAPEEAAVSFEFTFL